MFIIIVIFSPIKAETENEGFRGFEWGTPFEQMDSVLELTFYSEEENITYYKVPIDSLAGVEIETFTFMFYKGEFHGIFFMAISVETDISGILLNALINVYGEPEQPNRYIKNYIWLTDQSNRFFDVDFVTGECEFNMFSEYFNEEYNKDIEEKVVDEF
jgi:hypothetical protein